MIGQDIKAKRMMIVMVDDKDQAHAWDLDPVYASRWEMVGLQGGRTRVRVVIEGALHRRTKQLAETLMGELP